MNPTAPSTPGLRKCREGGCRPSAWRDRLKLWHRRHQTRLQLADLSPHLLRDLGLAEADRDRESAKWFWQS
jgi:uncharacterized protein YjiS (DUF1127 family)